MIVTPISGRKLIEIGYRNDARYTTFKRECNSFKMDNFKQDLLSFT